MKLKIIRHLVLLGVLVGIIYASLSARAFLEQINRTWEDESTWSFEGLTIPNDPNNVLKIEKKLDLKQGKLSYKIDYCTLYDIEVGEEKNIYSCTLMPYVYFEKFAFIRENNTLQNTYKISEDIKIEYNKKYDPLPKEFLGRKVINNYDIEFLNDNKPTPVSIELEYTLEKKEPSFKNKWEHYRRVKNGKEKYKITNLKLDFSPLPSAKEYFKKNSLDKYFDEWTSNSYNSILTNYNANYLEKISSYKLLDTLYSVCASNTYVCGKREGVYSCWRFGFENPSISCTYFMYLLNKNNNPLGKKISDTIRSSMAPFVDVATDVKEKQKRGLIKWIYFSGYSDFQICPLITDNKDNNEFFIDLYDKLSLHNNNFQEHRKQRISLNRDFKLDLKDFYFNTLDYGEFATSVNLYCYDYLKNGDGGDYIYSLNPNNIGNIEEKNLNYLIKLYNRIFGTKGLISNKDILLSNYKEDKEHILFKLYNDSTFSPYKVSYLVDYNITNVSKNIDEVESNYIRYMELYTIIFLLKNHDE